VLTLCCSSLQRCCQPPTDTCTGSLLLMLDNSLQAYIALAECYSVLPCHMNASCTGDGCLSMPSSGSPLVCSMSDASAGSTVQQCIMYTKPWMKPLPLCGTHVCCQGLMQPALRHLHSGHTGSFQMLAALH
jgi:hypothetical protein